MNMFFIMIIFLFFVVLALLIFIFSKKIENKKWKKEKQHIYACGEDIKSEHLNIPQKSFYSVLIKILGFEYIKKLHSGQLTRYLFWIFFGTILLIILLFLLW